MITGDNIFTHITHKEGAEIIVDNTQDILFGGFAPNSSSADLLSKALGSRTVMSGSVSCSKNDPSQSLQMIERPLLTADELKSLPKGDFIVMKTGTHPMRTHLKLFFDWGIEFDKDNPYTVSERANRKVAYAEKSELMDRIRQKYPQASSSNPNSNNTAGPALQADVQISPETVPTKLKPLRSYEAAFPTQLVPAAENTFENRKTKEAATDEQS